MNQVERVFSALERQALKNRSHNSIEELKQRITDYFASWNLKPRIYKWRKLKVIGSQISRCIANLLD
jgi:intein/homing endonuclease